MIEPTLSGDALLADIHAARELADEFHLWWLGQSGFLIQWQGKHLLLDPYLSESLTKKYAATDKPHIRMTRCPISPECFSFVDVITSSHNHTDHLDAETILPLIASNSQIKIVVPEANREFAASRLQTNPARLTGAIVDKPVQIDPFRITAVPAAHDKLEIDKAGYHRYVGYVVRFGPWTIYHSGDTLLYDGMVDRLRRHTVDVALVPINGRAPERRISGNLWGDEAIKLTHAIGARIAIPCHYDMFTFNTASPELFLETSREVGQDAIVLKCGQRWSSSRLSIK